MCIFRDSRGSGKPPLGADGWRLTKELEKHKMTNLPARLKEVTLTCSRHHDTPPPRAHRRPRYASKEATIITTQIRNRQSGPYNLAADCATLSKQTNTQASLYPSRQTVSCVGKTCMYERISAYNWMFDSFTEQAFSVHLFCVCVV